MSGPAVQAVEAAGIAHRVLRHGPVGSVAEAADAQGIGLGAGERGVGLRVAADEAAKALDATFADVTDPEPVRP